MDAWHSADGTRLVVCVSGEDFNFDEPFADLGRAFGFGVLQDRYKGEARLRQLAAIRDRARERWDDLMYWLHAEIEL